MFGTQQSWPDGTFLGSRTGDHINDGEHRASIHSLYAGPCESVIVGVVLTKQAVKSFMDRKNPGCERSCFTFTIRDSVEDFINVTCWGSSAHILDVARQFKISDVVEVHNSQVLTKSGDSKDEKWKPSTPGPYQLSVNENHGRVSLSSSWKKEELKRISETPIGNVDDYYSLGDILAAGEGAHQQYVNILAAVKVVHPTRAITTRNGQQMKCRDIILFDGTVPSFSFTLWDEELCAIADTWTARNTVLFISSVKVSKNSYRNELTASSGAKTIIVASSDIDAVGPLADDDCSMPVSSQRLCILEVMGAIANKKSISGQLLAAVTCFNVDDCNSAVLSKRCAICRCKILAPVEKCGHESCQNQASPLELEFDVAVTLSDTSGSLERCYFMPGILSRHLDCTAEQFVQLDDSAKTDLKWRLLLERFELSITVSSNDHPHGTPKCWISAIHH